MLCNQLLHARHWLLLIAALSNSKVAPLATGNMQYTQALVYAYSLNCFTFFCVQCLQYYNPG